MRVVVLEWRDPLEPLPDVLVEAGLVVVHEDAGGDVHRADEHEALGHVRALEDLLELRREVHELALLLRIEGEVFGVALHRRRLVLAHIMPITSLERSALPRKVSQAAPP